MNKTNIIIFASICTISFCYMLFFNKSKSSKKKKKIDKEIAEAVKILNNGNFRNDSTEK